MLLCASVIKLFASDAADIPSPSGQHAHADSPLSLLSAATHGRASSSSTICCNALAGRPRSSLPWSSTRRHPSSKLKDERVEVILRPKHVFGGLAAVWRDLTEEEWVEPTEQFAEANPRLALRCLERRTLFLHNHPQVDMVRRVECRLERCEDSTWARNQPADRFSVARRILIFGGTA